MLCFSNVQFLPIFMLRHVKEHFLWYILFDNTCLSSIHHCLFVVCLKRIAQVMICFNLTLCYCLFLICVPTLSVSGFDALKQFMSKLFTFDLRL